MLFQNGQYPVDHASPGTVIFAVEERNHPRLRDSHEAGAFLRAVGKFYSFRPYAVELAEVCLRDLLSPADEILLDETPERLVLRQAILERQYLGTSQNCASLPPR